MITIESIETALFAAESAIAAYSAEKAALYARRAAGELSYPAAEKARIAASRAPDRAVKALRALGSEEIEGRQPGESLMARCDVVDAWRG